MIKHFVLASSVSLVALLAATAAQAQDSAPTNSAPSGGAQPAPGDTGAQADNVQSDDVVVTGIRAALRASIDAKRQSTVIADIISAEDIGKFPDRNVAEALQRVPGIVINREFGEGERVSLRGTAPNLTKTLVDGHAIATADWFILEQLSATRSFNYLTLPSEIVGQLDVYKSPRADVEEGGVGGTINVHTRRPLEQPRSLISASLQGVYSERRDRITPIASGIFSWKNSAETFGILIGGVYERRDIRRDGLEILGYEPYSVAATIANPNAGQAGQPATIANPVYQAGLAGVQVPSLIGSALFVQERKRYGGNFDIQFRPSPSLEVNLSGLYSRFQADNFNQNFLAAPRYAAQGSATIANPVVRNGYLVSATVNAPNFAAFFDAIDRKAHATTAYGDLDVVWSPSDSSTLHVKGGYTEAHGNTDSQPFYEGDNPGSYTFDIAGRVPKVSFLSGIDPRNPATLRFDFGSNHQVLNTDTEIYGYADFTQRVDWGALTALKFGAKYTNHLRSTFNNYTTYGGFFLPVAAGGCGGPCTTANFVSGDLTPDNFLANLGGPGVLNSYFQIDRRKLESVYYGVPDNRVFYPFDSFRIRERVYGGYALAEAGGEDWGANFGLRVVHTDQVSAGNQNGTVGPGTITGNPYGNYTPVTVSRGYTDFLPSANLRLNLSQTVTLRFAAGRTVARADYTDIVPRVSLNPGTLTGAGGSPYIDPFRANQADVSLEWYPDRNTIIAGAFYYKDVQSYIVSTLVNETYPVQSPANDARYTQVCTPTGTVVTPAQGATPAIVLFSCPFRIDRRGNGPGGTNKGFELQVQRTLYAGIGVNLNYTYSDAQITGGLPVQGNSKHALNATVFYEDDLFSARLSYNYRSKFFITYDRATPLNQEATGSLDASGSFNVTENVALTASAVNLTNQKIRQYSGDPSVFRAAYDNGRQYYAGARFRF